MTSKEGLFKSKLNQPPPTGQEPCQYLINVREQESMGNFLRWYNNKDVVRTLEAMQTIMDFYHSKGIDMLKLRYTWPNLANICFHKSSAAKIYPFTESDKGILTQIQEDLVIGPSFVFTHYTK